MGMQLIAVNVVRGAKVRWETLNGRRYLVAPATLIVPGVLNGSRGALYYPPEEVARNPGIWNHVPLTNGHPVDPITNEHLSGRDPEVLERDGLGFVFNDRYLANGKRTAEVWFDSEKTKARNKAIWNKLLKRQPIELSTGLYTDNEILNGKCPRTGRPYDAVARNYRPDHLAILSNQVGACSLQDGCGVLVNDRSPEGSPGLSWIANDDKSGCTTWGTKRAAVAVNEEQDDVVGNHIVKLKSGKYRLLSGEGKNLGTFDSHDAAAKHEGEVEFFKTQNAEQPPVSNEQLSILGRFIGWLTGNQGPEVVSSPPSDPAEQTKPVAKKKPFRPGNRGGMDQLKEEASKLPVKNQGPNQQKHQETGKFLPHGAGNGKGPVHAAAMAGCDAAAATGVGEAGDGEQDLVTITDDQPGMWTEEDDHQNPKAGPEELKKAGKEVGIAKNSNKGKIMDRDEAAVVLNCKSDEDKAALNALSDETLLIMVGNAKAVADLRKGIGVNLGKAGKRVLVLNAESKFEVKNAAPPPSADPSGAVGAGDDQAGGEEEEESDEGQGLAHTPKKAVGAPPAMNAWLASMPPEAKEIWNEAVGTVNEQKAKVARMLIANVADKAKRQQHFARLMKLSLPELKQQWELFPKPQQQPVSNRRQPQMPNYFLGAETLNDAEVTDNADQDIMEDVVLNMKEIVEEQRQNQGGLRRKA